MLNFEHMPRPAMACDHSPRNAIIGRDRHILRSQPVKCPGWFDDTWSRPVSSRDVGLRNVLVVSSTSRRAQSLPAARACEMPVWFVDTRPRLASPREGRLRWHLLFAACIWSRLLPATTPFFNILNVFDLLSSKTWPALLQTCKTYKCNAMHPK